MRTPEQLERDIQVSINLNKAMRTAFRLNKETGATIHVYKNGLQFVTCFDGEQGEYADTMKFHATIENGIIVVEGHGRL